MDGARPPESVGASDATGDARSRWGCAPARALTHLLFLDQRKMTVPRSPAGLACQRLGAGPEPPMGGPIQFKWRWINLRVTSHA